MDIYSLVTVYLLIGAAWTYDQDPDCGTCGRIHPQQDFCDNDWAIRITVDSVEIRVSLPGEPEVYQNFMKVEANVVEIFKESGDVEPFVEDTQVVIWTPSELCAATLVSGKEYVVIGYNRLTPTTEEHFFKTTACTFHQLWEELTTEQKQGFRKKYNKMCNNGCEIPDVRTASLFDINKKPDNTPYAPARSGYWTPYQDCYYNPLVSDLKNVEDCETKYSYCKMKDDECSWMLTDAYEECFQMRETIVATKESDAAFTNFEDCQNLPTRRLKKKCKKLAKKNAANIGDDILYVEK